VTIDSPSDGATVSRAQTPQLALAGKVSFDTPTPADTKLYLRQNVCSNATTDVRSLAPTFSNADVANCGYTGTTTPMNEVFYTVDGAPALVLDYSLQEQFLPVTLDTSKAITGNLRLSTFNANGVGVGIGMTTIDVTVRGTIDGAEQSIGSTSVTYQQLPGPVTKDAAFSITPNASFDKKDATSLTFDFHIHGVNVQHGWLFFRGLSHVTVPSYTASFDRRVELSVANQPLSSTGVTLSPDMTSWSATRGTPAAGSHFITARAVQGGKTSGSVQTVLHVTA